MDKPKSLYNLLVSILSPTGRVIHLDFSKLAILQNILHIHAFTRNGINIMYKDNIIPTSVHLSIDLEGIKYNTFSLAGGINLSDWIFLNTLVELAQSAAALTFFDYIIESRFILDTNIDDITDDRILINTELFKHPKLINITNISYNCSRQLEQYFPLHYITATKYSSVIKIKTHKSLIPLDDYVIALAKADTSKAVGALTSFYIKQPYKDTEYYIDIQMKVGSDQKYIGLETVVFKKTGKHAISNTSDYFNYPLYDKLYDNCQHNT